VKTLESIIMEKANAILGEAKTTKYVNMDHEFLVALINGDETGLSDEESEMLDKWEKSLPKGAKVYSAESDDLEEGIDDITGKFSSNLVKVKISIG
jgi:hypothetical protein